MFKSLRGRVITILIVMGMCAWQVYSDGINLGLDLRGGMHLVLEVDDPEGTFTDEARADAIEQVEVVVRSRVDEFGVEEPLIQRVGADRLVVQLAGISDPEAARQVISQAAFLEFSKVLNTAELQGVLTRIDRAIVATLGEDSLRALGRDDTAAGTPQQQALDLFFGRDSTVADSAAADSAAAGGAGEAGVPEDAAPAAGDSVEASELELRPFTSLLNGGGEGPFQILIEDEDIARTFLAIPEVERLIPRGNMLRWGQDPVVLGARTYRELYVLEEPAFMNGQQLENAIAQRDPQTNQAQVVFELSRAGGARFEDFTSVNVGNFLAIVLDDEVVSAPVIRDRIGSRGQIDLGNSPLEEARQLALVLRAGSLPVPLRIMEERTIGPSLGQDSIDQGRIAGIIGLAVVVVVMIGYYRMAGVLAVLALASYVLLVMGGLAGIGANLTLPGIAGLILSVGMAVDANVLIFERIREELAAGRATRTAVDEGFGHALSAIVDANITTLITALILFQFGTGPVQGFAVTLSIGIVASFFTALYVTRTLFLLYLQPRKAADPISI